jgi:hypothetical protein
MYSKPNGCDMHLILFLKCSTIHATLNDDLNDDCLAIRTARSRNPVGHMFILDAVDCIAKSQLLVKCCFLQCSLYFNADPIMKSSIALLCALMLLTACGTSQNKMDPITLINGPSGDSVSCSGPGETRDDCYEKASQDCKKAGYKIVDARRMVTNSAGRSLIFGCQ